MTAFQIGMPTMKGRRAGWRHVSSGVLESLRAGAAAYAIASLVMTLYVLAHATDPRWSVGRDAPIDLPELTSAMPLFDGMVDALNGFANTVESGVNDVLAIKNAFLTS